MRSVRPFAPADAPAVEAVMRRSFALGGPEGVTLQEHLSGLAALVAHPAEGAVALEGDAVVGYTHPADVRLEVDPAYRRRGHGRGLLEAAQRLAAGAGDDQLELWVPRAGPGRAFAEAMGMRYRSSFHLLRLPEPAVVPPPGQIAGFAMRQLIPGADDAAYVALMSAAFADHPSPMHFDLARIREAHASTGFAAEDVLLAHEAGDADRLAAFCRATVGPAEDRPRRGDIRLVGVAPAYRRRGLGRELLRWGIAHVRAKGAVEVDLAVEALNAGALRLYVDAGFAPVAEWPRWVIASSGRG
jgi:mycothiol synthase